MARRSSPTNDAFAIILAVIKFAITAPYVLAQRGAVGVVLAVSVAPALWGVSIWCESKDITGGRFIALTVGTWVAIVVVSTVVGAFVRAPRASAPKVKASGDVDMLNRRK